MATTWSLAFEQIERTSPAAAELLRLCAFVAPDQVPEELLTGGASRWPAALQEAVTDRTLSLHRLVQVVQRARMTQEEQRQWAERLVFAVQDASISEGRRRTYWAASTDCWGAPSVCAGGR